MVGGESGVRMRFKTGSASVMPKDKSSSARKPGSMALGSMANALSMVSNAPGNFLAATRMRPIVVQLAAPVAGLSTNGTSACSTTAAANSWSLAWAKICGKPLISSTCSASGAS